MLPYPRRRPGRALGIAAALTVGGVLVCGSGLPALAAPAAVSAHAVSAGMGPARMGADSRSVLLVTGDRLLVRSGGTRQAFAVLPAPGSRALTTLRFGSQVMAIPTDALPYLGRGLSPSLFQLSALQRAASGGRLPVRLTFSGRRPAIPGLTVTRSSAGAAAGYLTAASARKFGAALARQYRADHSRGQFGSAGMFSHHVSISLAGAPAPRPVPAFKMHTLTVHGTNLAGRPDTGDGVFLTSADNVSRFVGVQGNVNYFYRGQAKFSVPAGHYWAIATFFDPGPVGALRMVVLPQFTVAGQHTSVHIAEKSASSEVTIPSPRPATSAQTSFEIVRGARQGGPFSYTQSWSGLPAFVSPTTRKPSVGTLQTYTSATLLSPDRVTPSYAYNLDFAGPAGLVPRQHFTVQPADLATVTERYYQDVPTSNAGWVTFGGTVAQLAFEFQPVSFVRMPSEQTQYFSASPGLLWQNQTITNLNDFSGGDFDAFRAYAPGQHETQDWNRYPLHPAPTTALGGAAAVFPTQTSQFRIGNTLELGLTPFSDNEFGHLGAGFLGNGSTHVSGSYEVDQNGVKIAHGNAVNGIPGIGLSPKPSVLRFVLGASRASSFFRLSASSQTIWTWRSVRNTAARVPPAWFCTISFTPTSSRLIRQCAVQPLMTLDYAVEGLSLGGLAPSGAQVIDLSAGHVQLGGSAAITGATAQVSYNDGDSWQPAAVTAEGGGHFHVAYSAPGGVDVTLRVSAADSAGGSIRETIIRAYGVSL
ncbi:MAG TPA: hypothetical protein VIJ82_18900 [Streptosporangiaceae bacterium]